MRLGDIISVANVEKCGNRTIPVLSMTMHDGLVLQTDRFKKTIASKDLSGYKVVRRNQLVVSFPIDEGVLYIQDVADAGIVSPAYAVWDVSTKMVLPRFLGLFLRSPKSIQHYRSKLRGSTARRRTIPREDFLAMEIPGFSIAEQDRICLVIEKIESVIKACDKQIQSLVQLVKSRFVEMFGDVRANFMHFPTIRGNEVFSFASGKFLSAEHRKDSGVPVYGGNGVAWYTDKPLVRRPTIVLGRVGAYCGNVRLVDQPAWITDNAIYIKEFKHDLFDITFLAKYMQKLDFSQFAAKSGQPKITQKPLEEAIYIIPPLALQHEFAAFVAKVDKLAFAARQRRDVAKQLYRAKIQEFFG